jgi:hypothetical protein
MILAAASLASAHAALLTQTVSQNVTTTGSHFTFNQFNTSLGTLTAVDLIINSSNASGNFTLSRSNAGLNLSASYTGLEMGLGIADPYDNVFIGSYQAISTSGNSSIAKASTNTYLVIGNQSLLDSEPYTASIASGAWSYYQGSSTVTLYSEVFATAYFTAGRNITPNYDNLFANTSTTLRYTYTPTPSGVPEPSQMVASLLVIAGLGIYFLRRRKVVAPSS